MKINLDYDVLREYIETLTQTYCLNAKERLKIGSLLICSNKKLLQWAADKDDLDSSQVEVILQQLIKVELEDQIIERIKTALKSFNTEAKDIIDKNLASILGHEVRIANSHEDELLNTGLLTGNIGIINTSESSNRPVKINELPTVHPTVTPVETLTSNNNLTVELAKVEDEELIELTSYAETESEELDRLIHNDIQDLYSIRDLKSKNIISVIDQPIGYSFAETLNQLTVPLTEEEEKLIEDVPTFEQIANSESATYLRPSKITELYLADMGKDNLGLTMYLNERGPMRIFNKMLKQGELRDLAEDAVWDKAFNFEVPLFPPYAVHSEYIKNAFDKTELNVGERFRKYSETRDKLAPWYGVKGTRCTRFLHCRLSFYLIRLWWYKFGIDKYEYWASKNEAKIIVQKQKNDAKAILERQKNERLSTNN